MRKELRERIFAYNRRIAAQGEKAADLEVLVGALILLPPGQLKKLLSPQVLAVLEKYGYQEGMDGL